MKKNFLFAFAVATVALASCSSDDVVNDNVGVRNSGQVPIGFSVQKQNITRAANLETVKHYNFGVWAWKVTPVSGSATGLADSEVMNHYLVGFGGTNVGYDHSNATTWAEVPGNNQNHISPWFYEGLGTSEYTYSDASTGHYFVNNYASTKPMAWVDYKSVNANQYLRYWDLAYTNTNFYAYAPYNANVTFEKSTNTMTFPANTIRDGYDEPRNHTYDAYDRSLSEFMYAGVQATNSALADVIVPFKHMGAQLFIRFYEDVPGYKVEIIDLAADKGATSTEDGMNGIQATPAKETTAPVKYTTQDECDTYNASLSGAVTTSSVKTPAVNYTQEEANEYNAQLSGAWAYGKLKSEAVYYSSSDADPTHPAGTLKTPAVYYTDAEVNAHNAGLTGAVSTSTVKTAAVNYTDAEAKLYNSQLPGAKKPGDIKTPGAYMLDSYYTTQGATVTYNDAVVPTYAADWSGATAIQTPLMFLIPQDGKKTAATAPANLVTFNGHKVIQEKVNDGTQKYSYSPTIYYPVAQPTTSKTGFTFHVSYRIIAEDNKEVITVHNATVHVPYKGFASTTDPGTPAADQFITVWQPNVKYTYTFKITKNSTGTTNPETSIDPTNPTPDVKKSLYPIVFDAATIDDYTTSFSEYIVSEGTNY